MDQKEIEQSFTSAGWVLDVSFADDLIIGYDGDYLSILAGCTSTTRKEDFFNMLSPFLLQGTKKRRAVFVYNGYEN
jgi:hypothetical protein